MSSTSDRGFMAATDQARFNPIILEFIEDLRLKELPRAASLTFPALPGTS